MAVCTYDNPATMQRECWKDGGLIYAYAAYLFLLKDYQIPAGYIFFGANIGDWSTGQLIGNPQAMKENK